MAYDPGQPTGSPKKQPLPAPKKKPAKTSAPKTPDIGYGKNQWTVTWGGVTFVVNKDTNIITIAGGKKLPRGSTLNVSRQTIDLPDGSHLVFRNGQVVQRTPQSKRDKLADTKYTERAFSAPNPAKKAQRFPDDNRQSTLYEYPVGGRGGIQAILDTGMGWLGVPYKWGGSDPKYGLDCSGLIQAMYAANGVKIPRVSYEQARAGKGVAYKDARPGDILAFDFDPKRPGIDHVGVYLGNGKMLASPKTGDVVKVQAVNPKSVVTVRRVLSDDAYAPLRQSNGSYVYTRGASVAPSEVAKNTTAGPAAGGGDPGNNPGQGVTTQQILGGTAPLGGGGSGPGGTKTSDDFGFAASFFNSDPELKKLLQKAIDGDWTAEKFAVEFQKTGWYRTHSASAREWIALNHNDPAAARRKVEIAAADIHRIALEMGADVTGLEAHDLAVKFLEEGWSQTELNTRVGAHVEFKRGETWRGEAGVNYTGLKEKASVYGVPMSEDQLARWVRDLAMKTKTEQDFDDWVKAQAKILYPTLARQIDGGLTPEDVAQLYVQQMADVLELDPNKVDWAKDPLIKRALSFKDPAAKDADVMPLWAFDQELKKDPRWLQTNNAANSMMGVAGQVLRDWGLAF